MIRKNTIVRHMNNIPLQQQIERKEIIMNNTPLDIIANDGDKVVTIAVRNAERGEKPRTKTMKLVKREERRKTPQSSKEQCKHYVQMNNVSIPQWSRITHENNDKLAVRSKENGEEPRDTKYKGIIMIQKLPNKSNTGKNNVKLDVDKTKSPPPGGDVMNNNKKHI